MIAIFLPVFVKLIWLFCKNFPTHLFSAGFVVEPKLLPSSDDIYRDVYSELFSKDTPPTVFDFYNI